MAATNEAVGSDLAGAGTITVSSTSELKAALANATGGETIILAAGDYGELWLRDLEFSAQVTIRSESSEAQATFSKLSLSNVANLTFDTVHVDFVPNDDTTMVDAAVTIKDSSGIQIINSEIDGGPSTNGAPLDGTVDQRDPSGKVIGLPVGRGLFISNSSDITLEGNDISEFGRGIIVSSVDTLKIINNEIHDMRTSPLVGADASNVLIEGNHFHSSHPWNFGGTGDHGDFIHFWLNEGQSADNIVIRSNVFEQGTGEPILGIFLEDNGFTDGLGYTNVAIDNNIILNGDHQGVRLENVDGLSITGNSFLQSSGDAQDGPTIVLRSGTQNAVISNNILSSAPSLGETGASTATIQFDGNLIVQSTNPLGENYVGDLFVNPFAASPTYLDLRALPGSVVQQLGVGASLTLYDTTPETLDGIVKSEAGTGLHVQTQSFSIADLFGPAGEISSEGARVVWDFGDGTSASGGSVEHSYAEAGSYAVTAQLTLATGESLTLAKTVRVSTPLALQADFDGGIANLAGTTGDPAIKGAVTTVAGGGDGDALRLDGGTVSFGKSPEFFNNQEYTLLFDFKKDEGAEAGGGRVVSFSGSVVAFLGADSISVAVTTSLGTTWLKSGNLGIQDADWHKVALVFSGTLGKAVLLVDGEPVAASLGLNDAVQTGIASQSFYLGDPTGKSSFAGLLDNVAFLRGAIDEKDATLGADKIIDALGLGADTVGSTVPGGTANEPDATAPTPPAPETAPAPTDTDAPTRTLFLGTDGGDKYAGGDGSDDIRGFGGDDRLTGGDGNDVLDGGDGVDRLSGNDGDDHLFGGNDTDYLVGGLGNDALFGEAGNDKLQGGDGDDALSGGLGDDHLYGDAGNDLIDGGEGRDVIWAGAGNDGVFGGAGNDLLLGEDGDDVLAGGAGADQLTGGLGHDEFVFEQNGGRDRLLDFNPGEDIITLKGFGFEAAADVFASAFDVKGAVVLHLDPVDEAFSWSTSNYVTILGISKSDLSDANISLIA